MQQELTHPSDLQPTGIKVENCANCGASMQGAYCYKCGQATRHFIKFFPSVVREIVEDTLDIDGRFGRTLFTVMFRPGRATADFLSGKRVHYTPPFRLYLFTSLLAFLLLSIEFSGIGEQIDAGLQEARQEATADAEASADESDAAAAAAIADEVLQRPEVVEALQQAGAQPADTDSNQPELGRSASAEQQPGEQDAGTDGNIFTIGSASDTGPGDQADDDDDGFTIQINNEKWDAETNPVAIGWMPQAGNDFINEMFGGIEANGPRIRENPSLLINKVIQLLPTTLFVLLPIFALILKFFYMFAGRYYMEHLIFSVHVHTFTLMILITTGVIRLSESWLPASLKVPLDILQLALSAWIVVYLYIAQKRVYRQGWFFTFIKYNLVYFTYTVLQIFVITLVIVIGAATL